MCTIKTGAAIRSQADVRNLVLALILRQRDFFEKESVFSLARHFLEKSYYHVSDRELQEIINNYLDLLCRNKELRCNRDRYVGRAV